MKRVLVLAAGSLSAVGAALGAASIFSAAPAVADKGCVPDFACDVLDQPKAFVNGLATQPQQFQQSINPRIQGDVFLNGTCSYSRSTPKYCPDPENPVPGILNQPGAFVADLASQPGTFVDSIVSGPSTFVDSIASGPSTFVKSITKPFGPDGGPDTDGTQP